MDVGHLKKNIKHIRRRWGCWTSWNILFLWHFRLVRWPGTSGPAWCSGPSRLLGPPERVIVVSSLPWLSRTVRFSSTVWGTRKKNPKPIKDLLRPLSHYGLLKHWNKHCPLWLSQNTVSLTPSGFTTFVTVTDWKNDRVPGWFGIWPAGGVRIWSRPPEETAESRSEKKKYREKKKVSN